MPGRGRPKGSTNAKIDEAEFEFVAGPALDELPKQTRGINLNQSHELLQIVTANGTATNGHIYDTEEAAKTVGSKFRRMLAAVEPSGKSARLTVYRAGDGFSFAVHLGNARKGKGTPRGKRTEKPAS